MNYSQLDKKPQVNSTLMTTMDSGRRADAYHWRGTDVSEFSTEKLGNILKMAAQLTAEEDIRALEQVRLELERRARPLKRA